MKSRVTEDRQSEYLGHQNSLWCQLSLTPHLAQMGLTSKPRLLALSGVQRAPQAAVANAVLAAAEYFCLAR